jgi:hypothetical protein
MSTLSESALYKTFRDRIMASADEAGSIRTAVGEKLYQDVPPEGGPPATGPFLFGILRIVDNGGTGVGGVFSARACEVTWIARPQSQRAVVRRLGDLTQKAFQDFTTATNGFIHVTRRRRTPLPSGIGDGDASVVQEQHTADFTAIEFYAHTLTP